MSANNRQVGGAHYKTSNEHWDMVATYHLGYFEGQITKYITRHRFKKGLEDAEKALHFAEKLLELHEVKAYQPIRWRMMTLGECDAYGRANNLWESEQDIVLRAVNWYTTQHLVVLVARIKALIVTYYPEPDGEADPRYVNQDGPGHG